MLLLGPLPNAHFEFDHPYFVSLSFTSSTRNSYLAMAENREADRQRSASTGKLQRSRKARDVAPRSYDTLPHRPRRPTISNSALLSSPGPLDSMLKTTFETGDLGIHTITSQVPQASDVSSNSRDALIDADILQESRSRTHFRDDRQQLPSHRRDTISEIVSLYGSNTHCSSRSVSLCEDAQGLFLTASNSRRMMHHKSSSTLSKQTSHASLQGSQSPYSYPARSKRPDPRGPSSVSTSEGSMLPHVCRPRLFGDAGGTDRTCRKAETGTIAVMLARATSVQ